MRCLISSRESCSHSIIYLIVTLLWLNMNGLAFRGRLVNGRYHTEVELEPAPGKSHTVAVLDQVNKGEQGTVVCVLTRTQGTSPP